MRVGLIFGFAIGAITMQAIGGWTGTDMDRSEEFGRQTALTLECSLMDVQVVREARDRFEGELAMLSPTRSSSLRESFERGTVRGWNLARESADGCGGVTREQQDDIAALAAGHASVLGR